MGTSFTLVLDEDSREKAAKAAKAAFQEGLRLNAIFSDYETDSELFKFTSKSEINHFFQLSKELTDVLNHSQILAFETNGCFDVTVGPISRLWRIGRFRNEIPDKKDLHNALSRVGYRNLIIEAKKFRGKLLRHNMVLDLGGIAKGYTADRMLEVLKANGVSRSLIDAGGDLVIGDPPRSSNGWRVKIAGRKHPNLPTLLLSNIAVATSGDIEQSVTINGRSYSHLIDPFSGVGITRKSQVTVITTSGMHADSLASALIVMGKEKGAAYLKNKKNIRAYFVDVESNRTKLLQIEH